MRCVRVDDRQGLAEAKYDWDKLLAVSCQNTLPLTHTWAIAWWDNFGEQAELVADLFYEGDALVAIAPLLRETTSMRGLPVSNARSMSNGYTPYSDVIFADALTDKECKGILTHVARSHGCDVLRLEKLRAASRVRSLLSSSEIQEFRVGIEDSLRSPFIRIEGDWDTYLKGRSSSFRKSLGRHVRKAERLAGFEIERIEVQSRSEACLQDMINVSKASWKASVGEDLETDAAGCEFLLRLIDELGPRKHVTLFLAKMDGRPVAYELLIGHEGTVFPLRADFDENYRDMSPGSVLMYHALSYLFESEAYEIYDCCASDYRYLRHWTKDRYTHSDVHLFPRAPKSTMIHAVKFQILPTMRVAADLINLR